MPISTANAARNEPRNESRNDGTLGDVVARNRSAQPTPNSNPNPGSQPAQPRLLHLHAQNAAEDAARLLAGLLAVPARTDPKFFYDAQGSALFDAICHLDEYHPTRTEAAIFRRHRADIARELPRALQWVDLGAGDGAKSRDWLGSVGARRYVGVDIAEAWLRPAVARIAEAFPRLEAIGVVADLTRPLALKPLLAELPDAPPLFFYPGSSIGNFPPDRALGLLRAIRETCEGFATPGQLLIGVDCLRDEAALVAGYDDALGVTAAFNRNLLRVANRVLDADFDPRGFLHRAIWNADEQRVEMQLLARTAQTVRFGKPHAAERRYAAGEVIVTEYSYKHSAASFASLLREAGFVSHRHWGDGNVSVALDTPKGVEPGDRYAVFLARP